MHNFHILQTFHSYCIYTETLTIHNGSSYRQNKTSVDFFFRLKKIYLNDPVGEKWEKKNQF